MKAASGIEIERRFLVRAPAWAREARIARREHIVQFYVAAAPERTVRVRLIGDRALLTVKGPAVNARRAEVECDIPIDTARALMDAGLYTGTPVEKTRSTVDIDGLAWQVDEFTGENGGLVIAEVELTGAEDRSAWDERVDRARPEWLGREITGEPRFANSSLSMHPFTRWPEPGRSGVLHQIGSGD
ncbi:MAG TPA: CYTH domain-containing protein [Longimicrobiales bacterium]